MADPTGHLAIRCPQPIRDAYQRICSRRGTNPSTELRNFIASQIRAHGDANDIGDLEAGLAELADRATRKGGRPRKHRAEPDDDG